MKGKFLIGCAASLLLDIKTKTAFLRVSILVALHPRAGSLASLPHLSDNLHPKYFRFQQE